MEEKGIIINEIQNDQGNEYSTKKMSVVRVSIQ